MKLIKRVCRSLSGFGTLTVDTAYGGDTFVIVDSQSVGFEIKPDEAKLLERARRPKDRGVSRDAVEQVEPHDRLAA